ncbi:MAG: hypothetical protein ABF243_09450 [Celeribacter marinus]
MTKRRKFSDKFKAVLALEALRGDKTVQKIAAYLPQAGFSAGRHRMRRHHISAPSRQICRANRLPGNGYGAGSFIWWQFFARQGYAQHDPEAA